MIRCDGGVFLDDSKALVGQPKLKSTPPLIRQIHEAILAVKCDVTMSVFICIGDSLLSLQALSSVLNCCAGDNLSSSKHVIADPRPLPQIIDLEEWHHVTWYISQRK